MRALRNCLVVLGLLLSGRSFWGGYSAGEDIRRNGTEVLFELAPVDPRSLLLGDYMTLGYDLGLRPSFGDESKDEALPSVADLPDDLRKGVAVIELDADGVAKIVDLTAPDALQRGQMRLRYTRPEAWRNITIGGNRYYFQSGTGERYEAARYGIFRVMPDGRALLTGLADEKRRPIMIAGEAPLSVGDVAQD